MKKKTKLSILLITSFLLMSCDYDEPKKISPFQNVTDELVKNVENYYSLNTNRVVYSEEGKTTTFYMAFSVMNYYGITIYHSLIAECTKNKLESILHTGMNISEQAKIKIITDVDYVFNLFSIDVIGDYRGYTNLTEDEIYESFQKSLEQSGKK